MVKTISKPHNIHQMHVYEVICSVNSSTLLSVYNSWSSLKVKGRENAPVPIESFLVVPVKEMGLNPYCSDVGMNP